MPVKLKIFPPDKLYKLFVVAWANWGSLVLALMAIPTAGAIVFTAGVRDLSQTVWFPLKIVAPLFRNPVLSNWKCLGVTVTCFWQLHSMFGHLSWSFKVILLQFKSHHAAFDIVLQCPCLHFPLFPKFCPRVIYSVKLFDLLRPQWL